MDIFGFHSQEPWGKFTGFQNTNELYNPVTTGICPEKSFDYDENDVDEHDAENEIMLFCTVKQRMEC